VSIPNDPSLNFHDTNCFTISLWVKRNDNTATSKPLISKGKTSPPIGYTLGITADDHILFSIGDDNERYQCSSNKTITDFNWNHFVAVWDGEYLLLYINRLLDNSTYVGSEQIIDDSKNLEIANHYSNFFNGVIDEIRIYERALSQNEIINLYNLVPQSNFDYTPITPEVNEIVYFTDNSVDYDGNITEWLWEFGDGNTSTIQHPTHQYSNTGIYEVTLTVTDNDGFSDDSSKIVPVDMNIIHGRNLSSGWNLIAVPSMIDKSDFIVEYNGYYYNWIQSIQETLLNPYIFGWNDAGQYYIFADTLEPWKGYWMFSNVNCGLYIVE
jgi:PKD repeat protein